MSGKFIPSADEKFAEKAGAFAAVIANDLAVYDVAREESEALTSAVARFRTALAAARHRQTKNLLATIEKNKQRQELEGMVRRVAARIRANDRIDRVAKGRLGIDERPTKLKQRKCPDEMPMLRFVRASSGGPTMEPKHELAFHARHRLGESMIPKAKPPGAERLELFVDLVPPDEPIPKFPGQNHGGRPWYLRSFTRTPFTVKPPMSRVPMRVVYWARWADTVGNVGPFSATVVGTVEGAANGYLPNAKPRDHEANLIVDERRRQGTYSVAVVQAQYELLNGPTVEMLPESVGRRQLEGPGERDAA
jgi:hypothetical protein